MNEITGQECLGAAGAAPIVFLPSNGRTDLSMTYYLKGEKISNVTAPQRTIRITPAEQKVAGLLSFAFR